LKNRAFLGAMIAETAEKKCHFGEQCGQVTEKYRLEDVLRPSPPPTIDRLNRQSSGSGTAIMMQQPAQPGPFPYLRSAGRFLNRNRYVVQTLVGPLPVVVVYKFTHKMFQVAHGANRDLPANLREHLG
jgi:hypothetical protein